jgi:hypothetical protein
MLRSTDNVMGLVLCSYADFIRTAPRFKDSETIRFYFEKPSNINNIILITLYELSKKEVRRRMTIFPHENSLEVVKEMSIEICKTLGIYVTHHNMNINASIKKIVKPKEDKKEITTIKENDYFLTSLIETYDGQVVAPYKQLEKIKENLIWKAVHEKNANNSIIGNFLDLHIEERKHLYRFAKDFAEQLLETDLKLSTKYIVSFINSILIEFPFVFKFSDFYVKHAFVRVQESSAVGKKLLVVSALYKDGTWDGESFFTSTVDISDHDSVEDSLKENSKFFYDTDIVQLKDIKNYHEYIKFCLKAMIYIASSEPDLVPEPAKKSEKSNPTKLRKYYKYNCPFDVIKVGYAFHGRHRHVDQTVVKGHFRWQPCGKEYSQVKLIWIDEHTRNYDK